MDKNRFYILYAKSKAGELSNIEKEELEVLKVNNPDLLNESGFLNDIFSGLEINLEADGDSVFNNIQQEINSNDIIPLDSYYNQKSNRIANIRKIAAAIFILFTMGLTYFLIRDNISKPEEVKTVTEVKLISKASSAGLKLNFALPDGSIVWLNSESKLTFPETFTNNSRVVELEGEAFFMVSKDPGKPFIVKSGELITTALGTSFNINNYSKEGTAKITLVTGRVLVELKDNLKQGLILSPGFAVNYSKVNKSVFKSEESTDKVIAWKDGVLLFEDESFEKVITTLSRWYGVTFVINNYNGKDWNYSGRFQNTYLSNVLENISFAEGFDYKIEQDKVVLTFKD